MKKPRETTCECGRRIPFYASMCLCKTEGMMFQKPKRWESKKYRDGARGQDCKMRLPGCPNDTETVVLAHRNGAGMGTKASDHDAADMCHYCHAAYDGRGMAFAKQGMAVEFERARLETIINRLERGILK